MAATHPLLKLREDLIATVKKQALAFCPSAAMQAWLLTQSAEALSDWSEFADSWNDMPLDEYMADGGRYRRRRYAVLSAQSSTSEILLAPHQPHYQSLDYNPLNGGVPRDFAPILPGTVNSNSMQAILKFCQTLFSELMPNTPWHIECHQFRIEANKQEQGKPTPEGVHRDGVEFVLVMMVKRQNISSGTTTMHDLELKTLDSFTLTEPLDVAIVNDHRCMHGVTPIVPIDATRAAYRDVLVVTFKKIANISLMVKFHPEQQPHGSANPLRNLSFLKLLCYRVFMVLSYQTMAVVVGWHLYQITHDPLSLGLIGLAEIIPYFCSALFAGYLVDHYSRRNFAIGSALILASSSLLLAAVAHGLLSQISELWIYFGIALVGLARAFIAPSYSAIFAMIMARNQYAKGAGLGTSAFQIGLVLGPAIGGILVGWTDIKTAYLASTGLAVVAGFALLSLKISTPKTKAKFAVFSSIAEGIRFVVNHQIILSAQALDMFAVLFGGAVSMLPAFIHDIYHYGPEGLGVLRAAPAVGAMITGVYLAKHPIYHNAGKWLLTSVAGFGVCIIAFGLTPTFWMAAFLLVLSGAFDGFSVVLRSTIMQLATPDQMRGRVASINGLFIGSSNELGAFESGVMAKLMGLVPSVVFGGLVTLGVVAGTAVLAPKLRNLDLKQLEDSKHE